MVGLSDEKQFYLLCLREHLMTSSLAAVVLI